MAVPIVISPTTISNMTLARVSKVLTELYSSGSTVDKTTMTNLLARKRALLSAQSSYDLRKVSSDELDSTVAGGGSSGGSPFQVIEWDPVTLGEPSPAIFVADENSILTSTMLNAGISPNTALIQGVLLKYASASTNISAQTTGSININNISSLYSPTMILFSSVPITSEILGNAILGNLTNIFGVIQIVSAVPIGGNGTSMSLLDSAAPGNPSNNTLSNPSETTITVNGNVIETEVGDLTFDFQGEIIMTAVCFNDFFKASQNITPNTVVPFNYTNSLQSVVASISDIPVEAEDGTVLKVIGHNGVLLGGQVLINDECTLFDNKQDFLLERPFATDITNALASGGALHDAVPQIQTLVDTTAPILLNAPISIVNHTMNEQHSAPIVLIDSSVREGSITLINRKDTAGNCIVNSNVPFNFINLAGNITRSVYNDNNGASYPDYREYINGVFNNYSFMATTYSLNFNDGQGIIKEMSKTMSENISDFDTDQSIIILSDTDNDGIISLEEQIEATIAVRVPFVNKKAGYKLTVGTNKINNINVTDANGYEVSNESRYTLTNLDIINGYADFTLSIVSGFTANTYVGVYAFFGLSADGYGPANMIFGNTVVTNFTCNVSSEISSFDLLLDSGDIQFYVSDPDQERSDSPAVALSTQTGNGNDLYIGWIMPDGETLVPYPPQVGDKIKVSVQVSPVGDQNDPVVWGQYTAPVFDNFVDDYYTITQQDIDSNYTLLHFTVDSQYDKQFVKFTASIYHADNLEVPASPESVVIGYFSLTDPALPSYIDLQSTINMDIEYYSEVVFQATDRPYQELTGGETTSELHFYSDFFTLDSKIVVEALVSDLPNTGFGESSITPPVIDGLDTYTITETDMAAGTPSQGFPVTFSQPGSDPYFVKFNSYAVDGTTGDRISANKTVYYIIYPLIEEAVINGNTVIDVNTLTDTLTIQMPVDVVSTDILSVAENYMNSVEHLTGIPFNAEVSNSTEFQFQVFYPANFGQNYSKEIYSRILRNNSTGVPVKGRKYTFTSTATFGGGQG